MYLSSFTFTVALLPLLLLCYYFIPAKGRSFVLLAASLLVYGWGSPARLLYLAACICYDYGVGLLLEHWKEKKALSTGLLAFSAIVQAGAMTAIRMVAAGGTMYPFGIAIYTLHGLGYLIGIYRGRYKAAARFDVLALYLAFFPALFAGPLMNYQEFTDQLEDRRCNVIQLGDGLALFIRGLAEKVVLADTFGYMYRELRQTGTLSMLTAWLTTLSFSLYLYFELFGYSEMARGLGRAFGFDLPRNFSQPFFCTSITAFMQSWNITLLLWFQTNFRYFLFGPHPRRRWQKYLALVLTWILIGAWYGTAPQFALWGLTIGLLVTLDQTVLTPLFGKRWLPGLAVTGILLQFAWVLFYADDLGEVGAVWRAMLGLGSGFVDQTGLYFFTSYIALLLLGLYIATDQFRNIAERLSATAVGRFIESWQPVLHGLLLVFCIASMLYGERMTGLWLHI